MTKRVLITGIAGFIGSHLALSLHSKGDFVVGIDNFNDYYSIQLKRDRAKHLSTKGIDISEGNVCDLDGLEKLLTSHQITHLVHLAAQAGVRYSLINPQAYVDANISGFLNVLECCRKHPHLVLIYASSSSVYGNNTKIPFSVDDRTDHQASFYGVTKKANELMAETYHHLYKLKCTGLRFFTVYGPWGRPDMAYFRFTRQILSGQPIQVFNQGQMQRDFTYIDDIIDGVNAAIDLEAPLEIFNLGNHRPEPLESMIRILEKELGKKAQIQYLPMQAGDVEVTYADIRHSQKKLGFAPKISLDEGLSRFVSWYSSYYNHRDHRDE